MTRSISHVSWQVVRTLLRAKAPLLGSELRIWPTRSTKDGAFLTEMAAEGLIERVGEPQPEAPQVPGGQRPASPAPFRTTYRLTERGTHAAEYGEYEFDFDAERRAALTAKGGAA